MRINKIVHITLQKVKTMWPDYELILFLKFRYLNRKIEQWLERKHLAYCNMMFWSNFLTFKIRKQLNSPRIHLFPSRSTWSHCEHPLSSSPPRVILPMVPMMPRVDLVPWYFVLSFENHVFHHHVLCIVISIIAIAWF